MLREVLIENFRSCSSIHIREIGAVLALLGKNGSGKTNILQAIEWASQTATSGEVATHYAIPSSKVTLEIHLAALQLRYSVAAGFTQEAPGGQQALEETLVCKAKTESEWLPLLTRKDEVIAFGNIEMLRGGTTSSLKIGLAAPCIPALVSLLPEEHPIIGILQPLRSFLAGIRYYPLDEPFQPMNDSDKRGIIISDEYALWESRLKNTGESGDSVLMKILNMEKERQEQFKELQSLLGKDGLGLVDRITVEKLELKGDVKNSDPSKRVYHFLLFKPSDAPEAQFAFSNLSVGTRRIIRILVSVLFDESRVLLMEQPEDAIHPTLMKRLIGLIKSYADPMQFIMATHSTHVFNKLVPNEVRLVTMNHGLTTVRSLTEFECHAAEKFTRDDGPFSDFLETVLEH